MNDPIPFVDLGTQQRRIAPGLEAAFARVLEHGAYILGPEVAELETALAQFCGARQCVSCANGTDALVLALMSEGVGPGDAVFVPAFTFVATAEAVVLVGATPVFVDVEPDSFAMAPESLLAALSRVSDHGLMPRAVIAVDLFGLPADYVGLQSIARDAGLLLIADAAQSFGARRGNRAVGTLADITTTSFFPAKPLGCYGDGGAIFTDDTARADRLRSLRMHGQGEDKYDNVRIGLNSRLDTLQAVVLLEKLRIFQEELTVRESVAARYTTRLRDAVTTPHIPDDATTAWALYTIRSPRRDAIAAACRDAGIPTGIYYRIPLHMQAAYRGYPAAPGGAPVSAALAAEVLSLPMHPYLDARTQDRIVDAVLTGAAKAS